MVRVSVCALGVLVVLLGVFRGAGVAAGTAMVEPAALAMGGAVIVKLSLACVHALVAAATACGQAGIVGAIGCAVSYVEVQQSCP